MSGLEAHGTISKTDPDRREVFGWAYVTKDAQGRVVVDKSGEFVDEDRELEDAAYSFVIKSRRGGIDHDPDASPSTMIESMVFTPEKTARMGIPPGVLPSGWWVGFRVDDDRVWELVKSGERLAFSVHGTGIRKAVS